MFWKPYVPVAERRAQAAREMAKLAKKSGDKPLPVIVEGRAIATTYWGKAWCDNLESYMDFATRLPRGRTYVRNGSVVDLRIEAGRVRARVAGSELYRVDVAIRPLDAVRWGGVKQACTGKIGSLVSLLRGKLSEDVLEVLARPRTGLFPEPPEIRMTCSCPDHATMCKHVAATLYGVGARLDGQPELFFTLRQVDQTELLAAATVPGPTKPRGGTGRRLAADKVANVFGIELDEPPRRPRTRTPR